MTAKALLILATLVACSSALAQNRSDDVRGTVPPGSAADGSRPADGAIKGGAILPGEMGGMPGAGRGTTTPSSGPSGTRCDELTGSLREQCLEKEQAASGASRAPAPTEERGGGPRIDPPPQVPR